jgi:hypothetical protein
MPVGQRSVDKPI